MIPQLYVLIKGVAQMDVRRIEKHPSGLSLFEDWA